MDPLDPGMFRLLAEGAPDAMVAHRDGVIVWANRVAAQLAGLSEGRELVGRPAIHFVPEASREAVWSGIARTVGAGEPTTDTLTFRTVDGRPLRATVWRWAAADGTVLVAVRNLEPERQQRLAEARARAFFDASAAALGISRLGMHVEVNDAYARLFGYDRPAALVGRPIFDLIAPTEHDRIRDLVRRRAAGEPVPDTYRTVGLRRDGTTFTLDVKASSYADEESMVTIVVMSDVSIEERRRHQERLEAIGRLAGGVAHDFNNLLLTVLGSVELGLAETAPDHPARAHLERIGHAAGTAADLVRQILTFGRKDAPAPAAVDPGRVVGEVAALARAALPSGVALRVEAAPLGEHVVADRTQLQQLVLNLLMNARDAVGPEGTVWLRLAAVDGPATDPALAGRRWARLRVTDDGTGIDPSVRGHLFEPYVSTKDGAGHGLGLAVVHGVVERLGGQIRVDSAPGAGATFEVWLPLAPDAAPAPPRTTMPPPPAARQRVLVVDDQELVRQTLAQLARSLGCEVDTAVDADEALARLGAAAFDVVLTDASMPGRSGIELAREVRARWPATRVVVCTGFAEAVEQQVREAGATLLAKPVTRAQLGAALRGGPDAASV